MILRYENNPIIAPDDLTPLHENSEIIGAFNAGVAFYDDEYIMLLRVAERPLQTEDKVTTFIYNATKNETERISYDKNDTRYNFEDPRTIRDVNDLSGFAALTSLSYLRIARSKDGYTFEVDAEAFIYPNGEYSSFGIEDARITKIDDVFYITYSQVFKNGITVGLSKTKDFKEVEKVGNILPPDNKDVVLFPEKINGQYYMLHRPCLNSVAGLNIWTSNSNDLKYWSDHKMLITTKEDSFESARIGAGAPPIRTDKGWLILYHGATASHRYCTGGLLLDLEDPSKVLYRSESPIFEPKEDYEKKGFFGDVVFLTGYVIDGDDIKLYYGVSDTSMAVADGKISEIVEFIIENAY